MLSKFDTKVACFKSRQRAELLPPRSPSSDKHVTIMATICEPAFRDRSADVLDGSSDDFPPPSLRKKQQRAIVVDPFTVAGQLFLRRGNAN